MEASLEVSCMAMPRTAYNGSLPFYLFSQLSPKRKAELVKEYSKRIRSYTVSNFQFDPQFRISYPGPSNLRYESLVSEVPELTLDSVKVPNLTSATTLFSSQLLPPMGDTLYVDFPEEPRLFDDLLKQYTMPTDGEPPRTLTPNEYLSYLKKSNKALEAGIYNLKSQIQFELNNEDPYQTPIVKTAAQSGVEVLKRSAIAEDGTVNAAKAFRTVPEAIRTVYTSVGKTASLLDQLYDNETVSLPQNIITNSYLALGLASTLEESIQRVAEIRRTRGEQINQLELSFQKMATMNNSEKLAFIKQLTGIRLQR